jgi:hypothetical protein
LAARYDPSNAGSITSSGGAVSQWNDLSGSGNHLTQSTGSAQPTTGATTIGGLNAIAFDNGDSMVSALSMADLSSTFYIVFRHDGTATGGLVQGPINSIGIYIDSSTQGQFTVAKIGVAFIGVYNTALTVPNGRYLAIAAISASNCVMSLNQLAEETDAHGQTPSAGTATVLGGATSGNVTYGEIRCYNITHDATQRNNMRTYLNNKWSAY